MPFNTQRTSPSPTSRLGGGGLDYITSSTFTTASAVNVNNCFTSAYADYRIVCTLTGSAAAVDTNMRMRVSGSDESGSVYEYGRYIIGVATSLAAANNNSVGGTVWSLGEFDTAGAFSLDLCSPALSARTVGTILVSGAYLYVGGYSTTVSTAYDGFSIYPASGTLTGTVTVFGYRKA